MEAVAEAGSAVRKHCRSAGAGSAANALHHTFKRQECVAGECAQAAKQCYGVPAFATCQRAV
eukprot:366308-Chlamydomonas_euryale.AAC.8